MGEKSDKVSGKAKQAAGDLTGDKDMHREGKVEEKTADVKDKVGDAADTVKDKVSSVVDSVKDRLNKD